MSDPEYLRTDECVTMWGYTIQFWRDMTDSKIVSGFRLPGNSRRLLFTDCLQLSQRLKAVRDDTKGLGEKSLSRPERQLIADLRTGVQL